MTNLEKYVKVFKEIFNVEEVALTADFGKDTVDGWDSVRQLAVVTAMEEEFDVMFEPEEIIGFTGFAKGQEILKNYEIEF